MAWSKLAVEVGGQHFIGHQRGREFAIPYASGLEVGDGFKAGGVSFIAQSITNVLGRDEVLLILASEVEDDKPKARRSAGKAGRERVERAGDAGRSGED